MKDKVLAAMHLVIGDTWPKRRVFIWSSLIFLSQVIAICLWAAVQSGDAMLIKSISDNAFWLAGAIIGSYVFGAVWDDADKRKHMPKPDAQPEVE
jgi:hypothetical protein